MVFYDTKYHFHHHEPLFPKNELLLDKMPQEAVPNGMVVRNNRTSGRQYWVENTLVQPSSQENPYSFSVISFVRLVHLYRMSDSIFYILIFNAGMIIAVYAGPTS